MTDPRPLTPRPWVAKRAAADLYHVHGSDGTVLAFASEEDARMMAAAPDMMLALRKISMLDKGSGGSIHEMQIRRYSLDAASIARAAIGKALNQGEE